MRTRDYTIKSARDDGDFIPMHYKPGDTFESSLGRMEVVASGDPKTTSQCMCRCGKKYFLYHFRTGSLLEMGDDKRCAHCGQFLCECETTNTSKRSMKTTTIRELASKGDGHPIEAIEGVISKLYEPQFKTKSGKEMKYPSQNGEFRDDNGDTHAITFTDPRLFQDHKTTPGKRVRIECHVGQHGMTGLKLKVEEWQNREYRKLWVTPTAKITWGGESGPPATEPAPAETAGSAAADATRQAAPPPAQSTDELAATFEPVEDRVGNWFRVFGEVCRQAGKDPGEMIGGLSSSDIKEITTGTVMSFKGRYGVHSSPLFRKGGDAAAETEADAGRAGQEREAAEPAWRSFVHPSKARNGATLGEIYDEHGAGYADKAGIMRIVEWAMCFEVEEDSSKDSKALKAAALLAADDLGITPHDVIFAKAQHSGSSGDDEFSMDDFKQAFGDIHGEDIDSAGDELVIRAIDEFTEIAEAAAKIAKKARKGKKPPGKSKEIPE